MSCISGYPHLSIYLSAQLSVLLLGAYALTLQGPRTAGPRKTLRAHLRLDVLADPPETTNVARQQRKRDGVQQVGHVALLAYCTNVHLETHVPLEHGRPRSVALVLDAERHGRHDTVRQLSHLGKETGGGKEWLFIVLS